jgi:hypothetical protein
MALKALENLKTKSQSKSWTDALSEEDKEVLEDALLASSAFVAQVRSWNDLHQTMADIFKTIINAANDTIVFANESPAEDEK